MSKYFSVLRINWIHSLEYRANAIIGLFAIFSGLFIEYQIWSLIFENSNYTKIPFQGSDKDFTFIQLIVFIFLQLRLAIDPSIKGLLFLLRKNFISSHFGLTLEK